MVSADEVRHLIGDVLQLGERTDEMVLDTALLGHYPELDSMAVVALITAMEEQFSIIIEDDDIGAETFETLGSVVDFVNSKQ